MSNEITFMKYHRAEEAFQELLALALPRHLSLNASAERFYQQTKSSLYKQLSYSEESVSSFMDSVAEVLEKLFNYFLDLFDKIKEHFGEVYATARKLSNDIEKTKDTLSNPVRFKKVPDEIYSRVRNTFSIGNSNVSVSDGLGLIDKYLSDIDPKNTLNDLKSIMNNTIDKINLLKKEDVDSHEKYLKNRSDDIDSLFYEIKDDFGLVEVPEDSKIDGFDQGKGEYIQSMLLPGGYQVLGYKEYIEGVQETAFVGKKIKAVFKKTAKLEPEVITPIDNNAANRILSHCEAIVKYVYDSKRDIDSIGTDIHRAGRKGIAASKFLKEIEKGDAKKQIIEDYLKLLSNVRTATIDITKIINELSLYAVRAGRVALLAINKSIEV